MARILGKIQVVNKDGTSPVNGTDFAPEQGAEGFSLGKTLGNIPSSGARFVGGLADAAAHPIRTAQAVGGLAAGGLEKLLPGQQAEEKNFDALVDFYKQRYGSVDQFLKTLQEDPVGVAADASTVFTGVGAGIGAASKLGVISKVGTAAKFGTTATKAGTLTNPLSAVSPVTSQVKRVLGPASSLLEKWSLRLTPTQKSQLGDRLGEVTDYISKHKIVGSPETRFEKASALMNATETKLDTFFSQMAKGSGIKKDSVIRGLQTIKGQFKNDRDSFAANRQIEQMIQTIRKNQGDVIPYQNLNQLKRTTYQNAYNGAGNKVLDDVEHSMGDVLRKQMETGLQGLKVGGLDIGAFNKQYGTLLESRKLLKLAMGRSELSNWSERLLGGLIGATTGGGIYGGAVGAVLGPAVFENLPVTGTRSAISSGMRTLEGVKNPLLPETMNRIGAGLTGVQRVNESIPQYPDEEEY